MKPCGEKKALSTQTENESRKISNSETKILLEIYTSLQYMC